MTARAVAWRCLQRIDHEGAYANLVVPAALTASSLDERDRAFVTSLVYGTTRMRRALDASIDRFVSRPPRPEIRSLLRLGAYQLSDGGVAAHAAVAETVQLAPKQARGFVNAILRQITRTPMAWPSLAVELSYPDWIVEALTSTFGAPRAEAMLVAMNKPGRVHRRDDGYIQDPSSQMVVAAIEVERGERILDVCAAPGGKATGMAAAGAFVVAADLQPQRVGLIEANRATLGVVDVSPVVADGTAAPFPPGSFDAVLLDAPCSGLGTLGRRPDARWRVTQADVATLAGLQRRLLAASAELVRPGGRLLYSVCTLLDAESFDHPLPSAFTVEHRPPPGAWEAHRHGWRVTPEMAETDGMSMIRMRRDG